MDAETLQALVDELEAAARDVDAEARAVVRGDRQREPDLAAALERLDAITAEIRARLGTTNSAYLGRFRSPFSCKTPGQHSVRAGMLVRRALFR